VSIIEVVTAGYRPYASYDDPTLPVGQWVGGGTVTGNSSGGFEMVQIDFSKNTQLRSSQTYSLEGVSIYCTATAQVSMGVAAFNLDPDMVRAAGLSRAFAMLLEATPADASIRLSGSGASILPVFLGRQNNPNISTGISFALVNVNSEQLRVTAEGYVWGARSVSMPGGPQRPLQGLYPL